MRLKVTLEVMLCTAACEEEPAGERGGARPWSAPVSVARSMIQQPECGGYTTVPLGELAGLF